MAELTLKERIQNTADNETIQRDTVGHIVEGNIGTFTGNLSTRIAWQGVIKKYTNEQVRIGIQISLNKIDYTAVMNREGTTILGWTDKIDEGFND